MWHIDLRDYALSVWRLVRDAILAWVPAMILILERIIGNCQTIWQDWQTTPTWWWKAFGASIALAFFVAYHKLRMAHDKAISDLASTKKLIEDLRSQVRSAPSLVRDALRGFINEGEVLGRCCTQDYRADVIAWRDRVATFLRESLGSNIERRFLESVAHDSYFQLRWEPQYPGTNMDYDRIMKHAHWFVDNLRAILAEMQDSDVRPEWATQTRVGVSSSPSAASPLSLPAQSPPPNPPQSSKPGP